MPTYQYRCTECGHDLEAVQKFTDAALTTCPNCGGSLRKIFNAVGVVFKGSGFYRTDSRAGDKKNGSSGSSESSSEKSAPKEKSDSTSGSGGSEKKSDAASGGTKDSSSAGSKPATKAASSTGSA